MWQHLTVLEKTKYKGHKHLAFNYANILVLQIFSRLCLSIKLEMKRWGNERNCVCRATKQDKPYALYLSQIPRNVGANLQGFMGKEAG